MSRAVEPLDPTDSAAVEEYERAFHRAFQRVPGNRLIRTLWRWDDEAGRVSTRIPYEEQLVLLLRGPGGQIQTAMGINTALHDFQSAAYGFAPRTPTGGCCELLTFFTVGDGSLARALGFWERCCAALRGRGFHTAYATTAPRPLPTYLHIGGELLETREIAGETSHFLRFDLSRSWMRPRQGERAAVAGPGFEEAGEENWSPSSGEP